MHVKLAQPKYFWHCSAASLTDLVLTIYNEDGTTLTTLATTAITVAPVDFLRITAAYTFAAPGNYRIKWVATGYTDWEECIVSTTPPVDEYPDLSRKYTVEGASWATPQLYILDDTLTEVTDCAFTQMAASVTSSKTVASFTIPAASYIDLVFDATSPTYRVNLTTGVLTLLEVVDEINTAIKFGRAIVVAGSLRIQSDSVAEDTGIVLTGTAAVLTELGLTAATYAPTFDDPPVVLTAVDSTLAYETSQYIKLPDGSYVFLWCDGTTVQLVEDVLIYSDHTYSDVTLEVVEKTTSQALAGIEVLMMTTDGVTVRRGYTLMDGRFYCSLEPGAYYAVLRRDRCVFGYNNFTINVMDRYDTTATNDFALATNFITPNYSDLPIIGQDSLSTMKAQFINLQGYPIPGITVMISHNYIPFQMQSVSGTAVAVSGHPLTVKTDSMGAISVPMVRGVTVEVSIVGTAIRRNLLVPDQAEFNLLDNFTSEDLFDIVRLQVPAAVQVDI
jgi:hypothetical protein